MTAETEGAAPDAHNTKPAPVDAVAAPHEKVFAGAAEAAVPADETNAEVERGLMTVTGVPFVVERLKDTHQGQRCWFAEQPTLGVFIGSDWGGRRCLGWLRARRAQISADKTLRE